MTIQIIDAATLNDWLVKKKVVLIDVREPQEHAAENITAAVSIPLNTISIKSLPEIGDKKLVFHCKAGKRSMTACEKLVAEDSLLEVFSLEGGISAWEQAGYPVNKK
ncbi:rhodanese-like domain-containing protein [Legionella cardiaca]|uniref:Rhodanese-like domain-containing protein n=1 Tax=Legionella cardiaca TaxID=1071983 RepID=A0ABY8ASJ0_9GAMM|nr:rhodanese-like domain-containing protein [Legionella cardiaca]WED43181.1 rhodanese-like domain-containing protein [Legionella cardiaca]